MRYSLIPVVTALLAGAACAAPALPGPQASPEALRVEVVSERPHDPTAFTEGSVMSGAQLFESTGNYGESVLREIDPVNGNAEREVALDDQYFGEGIAVVGNRIVQLTWREKTAFVYGLDFSALNTFSYDTEGWGLCFDGTRLVMSDGSDRLYFRDDESFALQGSVPVTLDGKPRDALNELECVDGHVYANVHQTDSIVRIDPATGAVTALIDASGMHPTGDAVGVMNGIAYDADAGTFLLTGKNWPSLFEVRFVPAD